MGCAASSPAQSGSTLPVSGLGKTKSMPCIGSTEGTLTLRRKQLQLPIEYAALTRGSQKDQDRFMAFPHGRAGMVCGICDGHSVHDHDAGRKHSEAGRS